MPAAAPTHYSQAKHLRLDGAVPKTSHISSDLDLALLLDPATQAEQVLRTRRLGAEELNKKAVSCDHQHAEGSGGPAGTNHHAKRSS